MDHPQQALDPSRYLLDERQREYLGYPTLEETSWSLPSSASAGRLIGLDAEFALTERGEEVIAIAIFADGLPLFESLVIPQEPMIELRDEIHGISERDLAERGVGFEVMRQRLSEVLSAEDILCGHGLGSDLRALGLRHDHVIDTLLLYPHPEGAPKRSKLKTIAMDYLGREIQTQEHSPLEDAEVAVELVKAALRSSLPAPSDTRYWHSAIDQREQEELRVALCQYEIAPLEECAAGERSPLETASSETAPSATALLETVLFLRSFNVASEGLEALCERYQISARIHVSYPHVVQLRYKSNAEPPDHPIVRECRGLILDASRDWAVIASPLRRFFNHREPYADPLRWERARVFDKLDGSLTILYHYRDEWRVASSKRPDGSSVLGAMSPEGGIRCDELFWEIWERAGYRLPDDAALTAQRETRGESLEDVQARCYLFELISPRHPIVVSYRDESLTLIGARDRRTQLEVEASELALAYQWRAAPELTLWDPDDDAQARRSAVERYVTSLKGAEGVILCDDRHQRLKVKSPDYLSRHWRFPIRGTGKRLVRTRYLEVLFAHEGAEFTATCPLQQPHLEQVERLLEQVAFELNHAYEALSAIDDSKAFALAVKQESYAAFMFQKRQQPTTDFMSLIYQQKPKKIDTLLTRMGYPDTTKVS